MASNPCRPASKGSTSRHSLQFNVLDLTCLWTSVGLVSYSLPSLSCVFMSWELLSNQNRHRQLLSIRTKIPAWAISQENTRALREPHQPTKHQISQTFTHSQLHLALAWGSRLLTSGSTPCIACDKAPKARVDTNVNSAFWKSDKCECHLSWALKFWNSARAGHQDFQFRRPRSRKLD